MGYFPAVIADDELAIITQPANPLKSLSFKELKRVYLRKSLLDANGIRWIPLNLPVDHAVRQNFSLALFNTPPEEQEQYWNELYFQGLTPPEVLASEEAVLRFIAITPGAIGYVLKRSVDQRVKILTLLSLPEKN
jgi:hypothetical protein